MTSKKPLELIEYFKTKEAKNKDGSSMDDKEKRKAALDRARNYQKQKSKKEEK